MLLPPLDLVEPGKRLFEFGMEQPHRIENFAGSHFVAASFTAARGKPAGDNAASLIP